MTGVMFKPGVKTWMEPSWQNQGWSHDYTREGTKTAPGVVSGSDKGRSNALPGVQP